MLKLKYLDKNKLSYEGDKIRKNIIFKIPQKKFFLKYLEKKGDAGFCCE